MKVTLVIITCFLVLYTIIATSRSTNDRLTRKMGIVAVALVLFLLVLQIINVVNESHTDKTMQDKLQILIYKTIDENEIQKRISKILGPSGAMMSWWYCVGKRKKGEKLKVQFRTLAIPMPASRTVDYVIIDSDMPGAPDFHPMIPGRRISSNDEYYIALVVVPDQEYLKNPNLVLLQISCRRLGRFSE